MSILLTIFTGVATGLAASALFWWLQAKLLRPKIVICPDLRLAEVEEKDSTAHFSCEFKIINRSRFAAADISIKANLAVPGLLSGGSRYIFYMRDVTIAWMDPGADEEYFIGPVYLWQDDDQKEYCTRLEGMLGKSLGQLDLRELMKSCPGSYVTVFVASNHAFSGARSFKHAKFTEKDFTLVDSRAVTSGGELEAVQNG
jgi:hypothetical protein